MEEVDLSDDIEKNSDDTPDPRIQVQLERLNTATDTINKLEVDLDESRMVFRQLLTDSTQRIDTLAKRLGKCVEQSRPYYDARIHAKQALRETQGAAVRYERAMSQHNAAREMVQRTEAGLMEKGCVFDDTWQEMLNHATTKVNDAEKEKIESAAEHRHTSVAYHEAETRVKALQKELKRAIAKSSLNARRSLLQMNNLVRMHQLQLLPYFELKSAVNQQLEGQKREVRQLEESVARAKLTYSDALATLERISNEIHQNRQSQLDLGVRGIGVGAESPLPPVQAGDPSERIPMHTPHLGHYEVPDAATQDYKSLPGHIGPAAAPIMSALSTESQPSTSISSTPGPGLPFSARHYSSDSEGEKREEKRKEERKEKRGERKEEKREEEREEIIRTEIRPLEGKDKNIPINKKQKSVGLPASTDFTFVARHYSEESEERKESKKEGDKRGEESEVKSEERKKSKEGEKEKRGEMVKKESEGEMRGENRNEEGKIREEGKEEEKKGEMREVRKEEGKKEGEERKKSDTELDEVDGASTDLPGWQVIGLGSEAASASTQYLTVEDKDSIMSDTESLASIEMLSDEAIDGLMLDEEIAEASHSIFQPRSPRSPLGMTTSQSQMLSFFHNYHSSIDNPLNNSNNPPSNSPSNPLNNSGAPSGPPEFAKPKITQSMSDMHLYKSSRGREVPPNTLDLQDSSSEHSSLDDLTPGYAPLRDTPFSPQDFPANAQDWSNKGQASTSSEEA